jgi:serine/threonine protein kinase
MALAIGSRIGPYEVGIPLGAGGMGEVYRARDAKLNRDVALKVLLPEVADDPERLARFRREAQILASLNHPNIAHLYGLAEADGIVALVLELVEGPTLADRIAHGAIPTDEALPIAKQIQIGIRTIKSSRAGRPSRKTISTHSSASTRMRPSSYFWRWRSRVHKGPRLLPRDA